MNIKIDKINDKKKYLDEATFIGQYTLKLIKNPHMNIKPYTNNLKITIIIIIIASILTSLACIGTNSTLITVCVCIIIIYMSLLLVYLIRMINTNKLLNQKSKEKTDSIIKIEKDKIVLKNNNNKMTVEQDFKDISFIKLSNCCIIFVNKEENKFKPYIIIPIEYKDELLKALDKYKIKIDIIGD